MNTGQETLRLIKLAKAVRAFANGILILTFFQHLFVKNIEEPAIVLVQVCTFVGTLVVSYILGANLQKIGTKMTVVIASSVMLITALLFSLFETLSLLLLTAITGIMPAIGQQIELFSNVQKACIIKQTRKQSQLASESLQAKQQALSKYQLIGTVFKALGSLFCMFFYESEVTSAQTDERSHGYLMYIYGGLCGMHLLIYLFVDAKELHQLASDNKDGQISKQVATQNERVRFFFLVTFLFFFGISITNLTTFSFFVQRKYSLPFKNIAQLIAGLIILSLISEKLAKKLIIDWGCIQVFLIFSIPVGLVLIYNAITQTPLSTHIVIFLVNFVQNEIFMVAYQKIKVRFVAKQELKKSKSLLNLLKNVGTIISLIIFVFFCTAGNGTIKYSIPLIITGVAKAVVALILSFILVCLGSHSLGVQNEDEIHSSDYKIKLQQRERLHIPDIQ